MDGEVFDLILRSILAIAVILFCGLPVVGFAVWIGKKLGRD